MMFQSEMENLELGLNLRSSDLLFPDDLLNIPLDDQTTGLTESVDVFGIRDEEVFADDTDCKMDVENEEQEFKNDLLAQILEEVKLPKEDVSFWPMSDDISFVDANNEVQDQGGPASPTSSESSCYSSSDDTQTLIDEMEEFLVSHETANNNSVAKDSVNNKTVITQNMETEKAEAILDALITGNISLKDGAYSTEINNISQVQTSDGKNVIIVITNDEDSEKVVPLFTMSPVSPAMSGKSSSAGFATMASPSSCESSFIASPSPSFEESSMSSVTSPGSSVLMEENTSSDSDWSPSQYSPKSDRKIREVKKRGPYKRSKQYNIKDKKERKKLQNVVAARRYRDKKKNEQVHVETEVEVLEKRNKRLQSNLSEMEGELKTLKKLMIELGLVKLNKQKKIVTV